MNNVKKIAILLLVVGVMTGFTQGATHQSKPDATLRLSGGSFALGIGFRWGSGTLTYKGKNYPVKVNGFSVGKVGVTGFCMGGAIALRQALDNDDVFAADAVFYGKVAGLDASRIRMPIVGSYGEKDTSIPAETVRAFRKVLRAPNDITIYPTSGHAFMDDTRASYVPVAAEDAWRRTIAFFAKYLK